MINRNENKVRSYPNFLFCLNVGGGLANVAPRTRSLFVDLITYLLIGLVHSRLELDCRIEALKRWYSSRKCIDTAFAVQSIYSEQLDVYVATFGSRRTNKKYRKKIG